MPILILLRHGQSQWNLENRFTGWVDVDLTAEGEAQARRGGELIAVLAEVRNTFGGHHNYLLHNPDGAPLQDGQLLRSGKEFHVSPFCEIEGGYRFRFYLNRPALLARIDYDDAEGELLLTAMSGKARVWSNKALLGAFLRMPMLTAGVMFRIHWQALKLWLKGVPFFGKSVPQPLQESTK